MVMQRSSNDRENSLKKYGDFETVYSIKIIPRRKWSWGIDDN